VLAVLIGKAGRVHCTNNKNLGIIFIRHALPVIRIKIVAPTVLAPRTGHEKIDKA
jgi:hypothetical protein